MSVNLELFIVADKGHFTLVTKGHVEKKQKKKIKKDFLWSWLVV